MITEEQISTLAKKNKINNLTIFREYLQLLFLNELYSQNESKKIFFKGGTAMHLIYKASRFSEDLDFTVMMPEKSFLIFINKIFSLLNKKEEVSFKEKKTIAGKRFLLTAFPSILPYKAFISLDFSFREKVLKPEKSIIETDYPVLFTSYVYHLSKEELFAEKIRAILTRRKGRDLYDLWFLLNQGVKIDDKLVKKKLRYYHLENIESKEILKKIEGFSKKDFILDMRPFVPINERDKLNQLFSFIQSYLRQKLHRV